MATRTGKKPFSVRYTLGSGVTSLSEGARRRLVPAIAKAMEVESQASVARITKGFLPYQPGRRGSNRLQSRSGHLRRTIWYEVSATGRSLKTSVGVIRFNGANAVRYARIHEFGTRGKGGTEKDITPKQAKYLWIPLEAALNPSGAPKFTSRALKEGRVSGFSSSFVAKTRNGNLVVFAVKGNKKRGQSKRKEQAKSGKSKRSKRAARERRRDPNVIPVAVLKRRVAIAARPFISPERTVLADKIYKRINDAFGDVLKEG